MKILTSELLFTFKRIGSQEGKKDPLVVAKFFCPWNERTRFPTEFSEETEEFFGYVEGHEKEWGYFSLRELESLVGPWGLKIERDLFFSPQPCSHLGIKSYGEDCVDCEEFDPCMKEEMQYSSGEHKYSL